jgi:hypothetical protein
VAVRSVLNPDKLGHIPSGAGSQPE